MPFDTADFPSAYLVQFLPYFPSSEIAESERAGEVWELYDTCDKLNWRKGSYGHAGAPPSRNARTSESAQVAKQVYRKEINEDRCWIIKEI